MYANDCSTAKCEAKRIGSVESAAIDLENTIARLSARACELADRLAPVLRPPSESIGTPGAPDYNAPLAQALQSSDRTLNRVEDQLGDLLDRLEI